ncbi:hypothetical protein ACUOBA_35240, partial [Escherichia coli]
MIVETDRVRSAGLT